MPTCQLCAKDVVTYCFVMSFDGLLGVYNYVKNGAQQGVMRISST